MELKKSLVIEGSFDNITKAEVFEVVGISRQCMEVVFSDEARAAGKIMVKAGQVLTAEQVPGKTGKPAFFGLYKGASSDFKVYTRRAPEHMRAIGTLAELIREARDPSSEPSTGRTSVVIDGTFVDFSLDEVLEVVSLSRQLMTLVLTQENGDVGQIDCKAGQVLDATLGELSGNGAFLEIYGRPWDAFIVSRVGRPLENRSSMGTIGSLVAAARAQSAHKSAEDNDRRNVVLEGNFDETNLLEVLQVVGLSRKVLEVVLSDSTGVLGAIVAKSGCLLDAQRLRPEQQGLDAFLSLYKDHGTRFRVVMRTGHKLGESLGLLPDLIAQATLADQHSAELPVVREDHHIMMRGLFSDISLSDVFDVASLGRQTLEVLFFDDETPAGLLVLKAGHVLHAQVASERGIEAFNTLVNHPASRFVVYRSQTPSSSKPSLGMLPLLYKNAQKPTTSVAEVRVPPIETRPSDLILSGDFERFSFQDVLDVIAMCRQRLILRCLDHDTEVGILEVKAGMVLNCHAGDAQALDGFSRLFSAHGTHFTVTRQSAAQSPLPEPLGTIADLLLRSQQPRKDAKRLDIVLEGSFEDFGLEEVLEVVALSRQLMQLSFRSSTSPHGGMLLKAGQVLMAKTTQIKDDGMLAIASLLADPGVYFVVSVRRSPSKKLPAPLTTVRELLITLQVAPTSPAEADDDFEPEDVTLIHPFVEPPPIQPRPTQPRPTQPPPAVSRPYKDEQIGRTAAVQEQPAQEPSTSQDGLASALAIIEQLEEEILGQNKVLEQIKLRQDADAAAIMAAVQQSMRGSFADRVSLAVIAGSQLLTLLLICVFMASIFL